MKFIQSLEDLHSHSGTLGVTADLDLLATFAHQRRLPRSVIVVKAEEI